MGFARRVGGIMFKSAISNLLLTLSGLALCSAVACDSPGLDSDPGDTDADRACGPMDPDCAGNDDASCGPDDPQCGGEGGGEGA